jgi:ribulose-5-phosphate 4-epimerase/fuculose-1-phosphate aldolase
MLYQRTGSEVMATVLKANGKYSQDEWAARQELAACYRIFSMFGWDELVYNHITLRVPGEDGAYLINPFGLHYSEITASLLIKVDRHGRKVDVDNPWPINQAGHIQHSLFHHHVARAHAVIHTHTTATMAVCSMKGGLQMTNFYAAIFAGRMGWHDFEGITVREEEGERILASLGDKNVLMLANHGPVVIGQTLPEAFHTFWNLQRACEVQMATLSMGAPIEIPQAVLDVHQRDAVQMRGKRGRGEMEFEAMVRRVDRLDRSWRD